MLLLGVDDFRVAGVNNTFNEMGSIINLRNYLLIVDSIRPFLDLVFGLHLNHLAALTHQVVACRHLLRMLLLELQEPLQLDEANVFNGALDWHVDDSRDLGQYWQWFCHHLVARRRVVSVIAVRI